MIYRIDNLIFKSIGLLLLPFLFFLDSCDIKTESVPEIKIELSADKKQAKANGKDELNFTIKSSDKKAASKAQIFYTYGKEKEVLKLSERKFSTVKAGDYFFYALYENSVKSETVQVSFIESVLQISVDKEVIKADGEKKAVFTLLQDGKETDDYILYYKKEGEADFTALPRKEYVFHEEGLYLFKAVKGNKTSNEVSVKALKSVLELRVDKNKIIADNKEEVTFSVYQDNEKKTEGYIIKMKAPFASGFSEYKSEKFKTEQAGEYVFFAEKGRLKSAETHITAEEKQDEPPAQNEKPVLNADKTKIFSDGIDEVVFTVTLGGLDVTSDYNVYLIGDLNSLRKISDNTFKTKAEGVYRFFAEEITDSDNKKSTEEITIKAETQKVFVNNVTIDSGWYDVNKFLTPLDSEGRGGDHVLCWAAAASNMIQWWLDDYQNKGYKIPGDMPSGRGKVYELAIFEEFKKGWENHPGAAICGIQYFFVAPDLNDNTAAQIKPGYRTFKGFFKRNPQWEEVKEFFAYYRRENSYVESYGSYYQWRKKQGARSFTDLIVKLLKEGAVAMSVGNHEVSVWGIDLKNGIADYIYITNSDDKQTRLHKIKLDIIGNDVYLAEKIEGAAGNQFNGSGKRIDNLTGLKAYRKSW